jgi:hypothetical protein
MKEGSAMDAEKALATIRERDARYWAEGYDPDLHDGRGRAALDRHALVAEVARLRAALKAGVEIVTAVTEWGGNCGGLPQTLQDRADWWRLDVDPVLEARQ